jgi:pilus assembly protein Flp/PilA
MIRRIKNKALTILRQEKGQGMVEYALLVGLIAIIVLAVLVFLGPAISAKFQEIIDALA